MKPNLENKGKLLDVGCGEGHTLSYFLEKNWSVKGIDFSSSGVETKNPHCREFLIDGDIFNLLSEETLDNNKYDVIWLSNVLEHVIEPFSLLKSLQKIISPQGILIVTVPNDFSSIQMEALNKGYIENEFWVALPDHLSYFDSESLTNIAKETGWQCSDILGDFPVDCYLYHPGSNYIQNKSAGKPVHKARVELENIIHKKSVDDALQLWRSLAQLGIGRNIIAFLEPQSHE